MTTSMQALQEDFINKTLKLPLCEVKFWFRDKLLASADGWLQVTWKETLELVFHERVLFTRDQDYDVIEVDPEIRIEAKTTDGLLVEARPANFSSLDFFLDTGPQIPVLLQEVQIKQVPISGKIVRLSSYISEFPLRLLNDDRGGPDRSGQSL